MAIPTFDEIMGPLLQMASDGAEHSIQDVYKDLASKFKLTSEDLSELLPSGRQLRWQNRVGWARSFLKHAGLLEYKKRGVFVITDAGKKALESKAIITVAFLRALPGFKESWSSKEETPRQTLDTSDDLTPEETLEAEYQKIRSALMGDVLSQLKECAPAFFEEIVIELLQKMGYGGGRKNAGRSVGRSGDGGIDGVIDQDALGLDVVYVQAKRWQNDVGEPEIRNFVGSLEAKHAQKGIFITTSQYTRAAKEYVKSIGKRVVLIDGDMLAGLMVDNGLGVSTYASYALKRIDTDYFSEE